MKNVRRLARGLGWFSIALGLAELLDSRDLEQFLGVRRREQLIHFFGWRELAAGIGILASRGPASHWLWARVGGDALDLAALGRTLESRRANTGNVAAAIAAVAGVTALDIYCAAQLSRLERENKLPE